MKPRTDETLFISDLHLSPARPACTNRFIRFLAGRARTATQLYILGDLFDAYLGDDDRSSLNEQVRKALKALTDQGTGVAFQPGNRDFLLGQAFTRATGLVYLEDHCVIHLYGTPTLLMHGDLLCSDDVQYLTARRKVRTPEWQHTALSKPLWLRRLYARWYRFKSTLDKSGKRNEIMDVNLETVAETMQNFGVSVLIHGHTHRPGLNQPVIDPAVARRIVLPEWDGREAVLCCSADGYRLESLE